MSPMQSLNQIREQAQRWSSRLGELASNLSRSHPRQNQQPSIPTSPCRLTTILAHLAKRSRASEHAHHKLKANEFAAGG